MENRAAKSDVDGKNLLIPLFWILLKSMKSKSSDSVPHTTSNRRISTATEDGSAQTGLDSSSEGYQSDSSFPKMTGHSGSYPLNNQKPPLPGRTNILPPQSSYHNGDLGDEGSTGFRISSSSPSSTATNLLPSFSSSSSRWSQRNELEHITRSGVSSSKRRKRGNAGSERRQSFIINNQVKTSKAPFTISSDALTHSLKTSLATNLPAVESASYSISPTSSTSPVELVVNDIVEELPSIRSITAVSSAKLLVPLASPELDNVVPAANISPVPADLKFNNRYNRRRRNKRYSGSRGSLLESSFSSVSSDAMRMSDSYDTNYTQFQNYNTFNATDCASVEEDCGGGTGLNGTSWCPVTPHYVVYSWVLCMVALAAFLKLYFLVKTVIIFILFLSYSLLIFFGFGSLLADNHIQEERWGNFVPPSFHKILHYTGRRWHFELPFVDKTNLACLLSVLYL